jgi:hypothetical protein
MRRTIDTAIQEHRGIDGWSSSPSAPSPLSIGYTRDELQWPSSDGSIVKNFDCISL